MAVSSAVGAPVPFGGMLATLLELFETTAVEAMSAWQLPGHRNQRHVLQTEHALLPYVLFYQLAKQEHRVFWTPEGGKRLTPPSGVMLMSAAPGCQVGIGEPDPGVAVDAL